MSTAAVALCMLGVAACQPPASAPAERPVRATRIVSLDYCADQFVLKLADRAHVLAVSPDATAPFSYMRDAARGLPTVRPRAEDVLVLEPDLVVRSFGGGPNIGAFLRRAGVPVVQVGFPQDLDDIRRMLRRLAAELGVPARGEMLAAQMDRRLARLPALRDGAATLYLTPSGVTAGPGTLIDRMLAAAGLENFQRLPGWRQLPLERLAHEAPERIAYASFGQGSAHDRARTPARHPVARRRTRAVPAVTLDGATTSCGGWFLLDAVERLAGAPDTAGR